MRPRARRASAVWQRLATSAEPGAASSLAVSRSRCRAQRLTGRRATGEIVFAQGAKPDRARLPDFSISHSGPWCGARVRSGRVASMSDGRGAHRRLGAPEAALKPAAPGSGAARGAPQCPGVQLPGELCMHTRCSCSGSGCCVMTSLAVPELGRARAVARELLRHEHDTRSAQHALSHDDALGGG